ncbi:MAG TPA: Arc family DNA-binding protein [Dermatophilaceae bacterium]
MPESSVVKSVRLPRELVKRLDMQAKAEHRTVNNLITKILTEALNGPAPEDKEMTA